MRDGAPRPRYDVRAARQRWAEAEAGRLLRAAIAAMDREGQLPDDFERRDDPSAPGTGRRWRDCPETCNACNGSGGDGYGGPCPARCNGGER